MTPAQLDEVSSLFLRPGRRGRLLPDQARCLVEAQACGGLVAGLGCGAGKTLTSLLLPRVVPCERPVLVVPGALVAKTAAEHARYAEDWDVASPVVVSYQELGVASGADVLESLRPDLLVFDEVHFIKNLDAAVTRRVLRYYSEHPACSFAGLSGTLVRRGLADYAHFLILALRDRAPVPQDPGTLRVWCDQLTDDAGSGFLFRRRSQGVPSKREFAVILESCPGVVLSRGEADCAASLLVRPRFYEAGDEVERAFRTLREDWEAPDGWWLSDAVQVWALARQLALGMSLEWDPRPPPELVEARRRWGQYVRAVLARSERWDSPGQVEAAVDAGDLQATGAPRLSELRRLEAAYSGAQVVRRFASSGADESALAWMAEGPGIVWSDFPAWGRELAARAGVPYYGADGVDSRGSPIESERGDRPIVASRQANGTGRNLQAFDRMLVTTPMTGGLDWEQTLAREHRAGQESDQVTCDVLVGCAEHLRAFREAVLQTASVKAREGLSWRLGYCDVDPVWHEPCTRVGWRWDRPPV